MNKNEMIGLYRYVKSILTPDTMFPNKFIYMINKNKKRMEAELVNIQNAQPNPPAIVQKKRYEILSDYLVKDEEGKIIWDDKKNQIPKYTDTEAVKKRLSEMEAEFKTEIDEYQKQVDEFEKYLQTDIDFEFLTTGIENFPKEMTIEMMEKLEVFVQE